MSSSVNRSPGGQPSTMQPSEGPWLSPQVVTRKRCPNVLCDMETTGLPSWPDRSRRRAAPLSLNFGPLIGQKQPKAKAFILHRRPDVGEWICCRIRLGRPISRSAIWLSGAQEIRAHPYGYRDLMKCEYVFINWA